MTKAERTEHIKSLSKVALGILRRVGERYNVDRAGVRHRIVVVRHNEMKLELSRPVAEDRRVLVIRCDGATVLHVEWTTAAVGKTSYRPGEWEDALLRYDWTPALAGSAKAAP